MRPGDRDGVGGAVEDAAVDADSKVEALKLLKPLSSCCVAHIDTGATAVAGETDDVTRASKRFAIADCILQNANLIVFSELLKRLLTGKWIV